MEFRDAIYFLTGCLFTGCVYLVILIAKQGITEYAEESERGWKR